MTATPPGTAPAFTVTLEPQQWRFVTGGEIPLAKAALQAGIRLRVSCQNGTCRACLCRMAGGSVRYAIDWPGLSSDERRDGHVLPCVAQATSDLTLIDVHATRQPPAGGATAP